jgi:hypothetical protein
MLLLCVAGYNGVLAQTPELQPNPKVEELLRKSPEGEQIVELKGYVGPSAPDTVRLYQSLSLSHYYEIPRSAIVSATREGDPTTGPVKLYIRASTPVVLATQLSADKAAFASARIDKSGGVLDPANPCYNECAACVIDALSPIPPVHCAACIACYATH